MNGIYVEIDDNGPARFKVLECNGGAPSPYTHADAVHAMVLGQIEGRVFGEVRVEIDPDTWAREMLGYEPTPTSGYPEVGVADVVDAVVGHLNTHWQGGPR